MKNTIHLPRAAHVAAILATLTSAACRSRGPIPPTAPGHLAATAAKQVEARYPDVEEVRTDMTGVAHDEDEFKRWAVELEAGRCYYFSGVADEQTAEELSLGLYDASDDEVEDEAEDDPPHVMMEYCPQVTGTFYLQAQVEEGRGHFHVSIFSKEHVAPPPPVEPAPAPEPGVDLDARVAKIAASAAAGAERVGTLYEGEADLTDWYAALEAGKCYWLVGAGDDDISELYLYLWNPQSDRVGHTKPESREVSLGHCPTQSGMYHFQAKVGSGSGKYAVGIYAK